MERHINSIHLEIKHKCPVCEKEFSTKDSLTRHINEVHEGTRKFKCPECPLRFARQETLDRHVSAAKDNRRVHGVALICSTCGKEYVAPTHHAAGTKDCNGISLTDPAACGGKYSNQAPEEKSKSKGENSL